MTQRTAAHIPLPLVATACLMSTLGFWSFLCFALAAGLGVRAMVQDTATSTSTSTAAITATTAAVAAPALRPLPAPAPAPARAQDPGVSVGAVAVAAADVEDWGDAVVRGEEASKGSAAKCWRRQPGTGRRVAYACAGHPGRRR